MQQHKQQQERKLNNNATASTSNKNKAQSLVSLPQTKSFDSISLQMATSIEVPSAGSDISGNSLGVTQSCSFTTNNNTQNDEGKMTQLQMRRKRAREVLLARRHVRS
mmetsp:Transcript_19617/g.42594  ORF Transcript_19617/g.42594 Transcript_19617/m.42594 type:complete len:107 (+) Transcript_19617:1946-2266(+)